MRPGSGFSAVFDKADDKTQSASFVSAESHPTGPSGCLYHLVLGGLKCISSSSAFGSVLG